MIAARTSVSIMISSMSSQDLQIWGKFKQRIMDEALIRANQEEPDEKKINTFHASGKNVEFTGKCYGCGNVSLKFLFFTLC
jgi:hypothetical protein